MPPNTIDIPIDPNPDISTNEDKPRYLHQPPAVKENYGFNIFQSSLSLIAHILVGAIVWTSLLFSLSNGMLLGPTPLHIVLCVIGYHFLMAEAILSLTTEGGWSSKLTLVQRRRVHWFLQIAGSGLAIGGSIHKILDKAVHWDTLHGIFGLVAIVFTGLSLVNGLTSLYAYELRRLVPGSLCKISHICFGIVAFAAASISLIFGFEKSMFTNWATKPLADTIIAFTVTLTFIVILNPVNTFYYKSKNLIKK